MRSVDKKKITWLTICLFIFLAVIGDMPLRAVEKESGRALIEEGQKLFDNSDYQAAIDIWLQAVPLIKEKLVLARLYLQISLAHFKLGQDSRAEDFLRQMFETQPRKIIKEEDLDSDFLILYNKVKAEYWFNFRVESKEDQESQQKVIEKLIKKPKAKKKKILPILIIGFVVITAAVLTIILSSKEEKNYGTLLIRNNASFNILVSVAGIERTIGSGEYSRFFLSEGNYEVELYDISHSQIYSITIKKNQTVSINFSGWSE